MKNWNLVGLRITVLDHSGTLLGSQILRLLFSGIYFLSCENQGTSPSRCSEVSLVFHILVLLITFPFFRQYEMRIMESELRRHNWVLCHYLLTFLYTSRRQLFILVLNIALNISFGVFDNF